MKKIESFTVNHLTLKRGLYVSRQDKVGENVITTFDIRMKEPNKEPVINTAELHTMEHLGATFLRNHKTFGDKAIYFGPMGCRTGMYIILNGDLISEDIVDLMKEMFLFMAEYNDVVPGEDAISCGNFHDMNLPMAKFEAKKYYDEVLNNLTEQNLKYS